MPPQGPATATSEKRATTLGETITSAADVVERMPFYKLFFIIASIGYILIALRGYMGDKASVERYGIFILLAALFSLLAYYLRRLESEPKSLIASTEARTSTQQEETELSQNPTR